ncbi:MAG: cobyric acid synthase [Candidatus Hodgkinia cicadicola]
MIQATSSDAGKTLLCLCLCKIAEEMGIRVAPFKAQNMSNNTVVAFRGGEVSAAQWLQATGCGLMASVNMSPVVVKPKANCRSQILVRGVLECNNYIYPGGAEFREYLRACVVSSFKQLAKRHELIVIEGSGAASEVNLREYDISNMWLASALNCSVVLISDIERGGVFASLVGTHCLLSASELRLIKGFVINKFSGRTSLVRPGVELVSKKTGWPCYGIVPWLVDADRLPSEDSLWRRRRVASGASVGIIIDLPFFCNYNDYTPLDIESGLSVLYAKTPPVCAWRNIKFIILPDTTSLEAGLEFVLSLGWDIYIRHAHKRGIAIVGIGAGLLMLSDYFISNNVGLRGLRLLRASVSILSTPPLVSVCYCKPLDVSAKICVNKLIHYNSCGSAVRTHTLLASANMEHGVYNSNAWGICVQGLFLNDVFRCAFLKMLGIRSCYSSYLDKVNGVIAKVAYSVAPNLSAELLALIRGD